MALRLGLVGHGRWGRNIARTLQMLPDVSVAIIGRGESPPVRLDGVLIATQSATHANVALPYIDAGIATFIEKPMTTTLADAERIRDAAARSGAVVFVGHLFLYHPAFLAARELLPQLGTVRQLRCEGMNDNPRADSSVLWDWLPHDLSIARAIFGCEPANAAAWSLSGGTKAEAALAMFSFGGAPVVSTASWLSPVRRRQVTIACDEATLVFDNIAARRLALHRKNGDITYPPYSDDLPLTREMAAFLQAIRSGRADGDHVQTSLSIVRAIAAAEQSIARGGQPVPI
jgi:predicted dehydrogenase